MNKPRNECPRCEKCVHRTLELSPIYHKFIVGCNAKKCEDIKKGVKDDKTI